MGAQYTSSITQQPLLSANDYAAAAAPFAIQPTGLNYAAYPGGSMLLGSGAMDFLDQAYGADMGADNAAGLVNFGRNYDQAQSSLANAQNQAQANTGLAALQYAQGQQAAGLQRQNALRNYGANSLDFIGQLLGLT